MQAHFRDYICDHGNIRRQGNQFNTASRVRPNRFNCQLPAEYFKHAQCYREHVFAQDEAMPCLNNYLLGFEQIERTLSGGGKTQTEGDKSGETSFMTWRNIVCCSHERKRECTRQLASKHCGKSAPEPFDSFFEQIHFGFFEILCNIGPIMKPDSQQCNTSPMPDWQAEPEGLQSHSAVSRLLVSYFPFNYVSLDKRNQIHQLYRKLKLNKLKESNTGST